jgi:sulfate adenylyltransferase subunit 1 (EFTu-like GTPase family)
MSALLGDNVITKSDRTPYFDGPPLLEYLETVSVKRNTTAGAVPVSRCRWCCGPTTSSAATRADRLRHDPHRRHDHHVARPASRRRSAGSSRSTATSILAFAPMSVTLTLDHEIDISRGDVLTVTRRS